MRKLLKKIEAALTAAAFAEEGEVETARRILSEADQDAGRTEGKRRRPSRPAKGSSGSFPSRGPVRAA
jgi:hypothetical protein